MGPTKRRRRRRSRSGWRFCATSSKRSCCEPGAGVNVLVVGAGPTGLSLAIELARHGVPFRLIDRATARSDRSRALVVQARSLELMRPWGVAEELVACGQQTYSAQLFVEKALGANVAFSAIGVD